MMKNYYNYILFFPLMMISLLMIMISSSWFSYWMLMEINLISFMMLMIFDKNIKNELFMNYFLVQSFNSYLFLMSSMMLNYKFVYMNFFVFFMILSMLTKLGLPPFFFWYLKIMNNLNWYNFMLMSTLQKLIPLFIILMMLSIMKKSVMVLVIIMLVVYSLFFSIMNINNMNMKLLMTYSSIIQISWLIILLFMNENYFFMYFLIYLFISMNLFMVFYKLNLNELNDLMLIKFKNKLIYLLIMFMLMSLGGIPPMFGFMMKWISLDLMSLNMSFYLIMLLILNSLVSMFFYLRLMFLSFMMYYTSMKLNLKFINYFEFNNNFYFMNWLMFIMLMFYEII